MNLLEGSLGRPEAVNAIKILADGKKYADKLEDVFRDSFMDTSSDLDQTEDISGALISRLIHLSKRLKDDVKYFLLETGVFAWKMTEISPASVPTRNDFKVNDVTPI